MNKSFVLTGLCLAFIGGMLNYLLDLLRIETFRADLLPWVQSSDVAILVGVAITLIGLLTRESTVPRLDTSTASKYLAYLAIANTTLSAVFAFPVLDPAFEFPILITRWPGIYMVIAFFSFVIIGALGNEAWSNSLRNLRDTTSMQTLSKLMFVSQIILTEVGALGLAVFMFLGGYAGASLDYSGGGPGVVGTVMEFAVIPSAISIFLIIAGELVGVANVFSSLLLNVPGESRSFIKPVRIN